MHKIGLVAVAVVLGACSGNSTGTPDEVGGSAGLGGGGSAAGSGPAGGASSAGSSSGGAGGTTSKAGASGSAGAANGGNAGSGTSGSAGSGGSSGASGGPPMIPDDAGSGACHDYTPCGGDVVGSWDIEICADPPLMGLRTFCPAATETLTMSGTADIRADGTMTTALTVAVETSLPASCVAELGPCGEAGQGLNLLADCTPGAAGSCLCSSLTENEPSDATYTTTPEGLLTVVRDGEPSYTYYCRQGDEFWARGVDDDRITVLHFSKR